MADAKVVPQTGVVAQTGGVPDTGAVASAEVVAAMRQRLAALAPDLVEIYDESAEHAGHEGAKGGGGHYHLLIVARAFEGASRVARHRKIYAALGTLLQREIHALAISAYTPEELGRVLPA